MDHPHSGNQEKGKQNEDRKPSLAMERELIVVCGPALRDGEDHPQDGAGRMIMMGNLLLWQLREVPGPECDEGECEQHQHPKPCFAKWHLSPAFSGGLSHQQTGTATSVIPERLD